MAWYPQPSPLDAVSIVWGCIDWKRRDYTAKDDLPSPRWGTRRLTIRLLPNVGNHTSPSSAASLRTAGVSRCCPTPRRRHNSPIPHDSLLECGFPGMPSAISILRLPPLSMAGILETAWMATPFCGVHACISIVVGTWFII
ncbi:hypothetical protein DdX_09050 [Ditylenchus destructor]|uniref:Uncharacterized protein n=1 Tax=Ditylenchus destructor TaxID=166010 RepID=A0AAD4N3E0_9BILA|nr:hypothetical protein DdX_09050 [Ditylenchus destructor]